MGSRCESAQIRNRTLYYVPFAPVQADLAISSTRPTPQLPATLPQDDAAEDLDEEDVDWRIFSQRHSLTDKMQKLADQVRRKELKCENLKKESDKIVAKERWAGAVLFWAWLPSVLPAIYCDSCCATCCAPSCLPCLAACYDASTAVCWSQERVGPWLSMILHKQATPPSGPSHCISPCNTCPHAPPPHCPTSRRAEGGLTDGQAATLVRNERATQSLQDEIEELDEQLNDMARAALQGRRKAAEAEAAAEGGAGAKKRRRLDDSDEEYLGESDDEDEFYDRTSGAVKVGGVVVRGVGGAVQVVKVCCGWLAGR